MKEKPIGFAQDKRIIAKYNFKGSSCLSALKLKNGGVRLSDESVGIIKWLRANTVADNQQIRRMFCVSKQCVSMILNGHRRKKAGVAIENQVDRFFKTRDYLK